MSRETRTNFPGAFRVVIEDNGYTTYQGPYQTLGAAKGQLTQQVEGWYAREGKTGYIERTTGPWEKVEDL
jgi:hypothetical protein